MRTQSPKAAPQHLRRQGAASVHWKYLPRQDVAESLRSRPCLPDAKDLHHLSLMSGYGAHLLHGFQPHFLHPLNPAVSTASGTSPFSGGGAFVKPFPSNLPLPSAFAPPKCLGFGIDQGLLFGSSGSGSESFRTDSSSPACTSLSPPAKDESLEGQTSEDGDRERDRICTPERSPETPGFRHASKRYASPYHTHINMSEV
uniref:Uncharacterized protein n=1 Tax=Anopheles merus TaxID=30066 RepID=A0A182V6W8_ANOME